MHKSVTLPKKCQEQPKHLYLLSNLGTLNMGVFQRLLKYKFKNPKSTWVVIRFTVTAWRIIRVLEKHKSKVPYHCCIITGKGNFFIAITETNHYFFSPAWMMVFPSMKYSLQTTENSNQKKPEKDQRILNECPTTLFYFYFDYLFKSEVLNKSSRN